jgi:hypothetical protein
MCKQQSRQTGKVSYESRASDRESKVFGFLLLTIHIRYFKNKQSSSENCLTSTPITETKYHLTE